MPAAGDILVSSGAAGGTLTWSATPIGGNRYALDIEVANMPRGSFRFLTVTSNASDIIESCTIEAWGNGMGTGGLPGISVTFDGVAGGTKGAIESLESISITPALPGQDQADINVGITLDPTAGSGRLGNAAGTTRIESLSFGILECRELTADIQPPSGFAPGNITSITVNGDMTGNVEGDDIGRILVSGDIGIPAVPGVDPGLKVEITADEDLDIIEADNIHADIYVNEDMKRVYVFGSGGLATPATDAVFQGTLRFRNMQNSDGIRVWGDLEANVTVVGEMRGAATRIAIGNDLEGNIVVGNDGMSRGITIGWMPAATGEWNGNVTVAGQLLSPTPDYTQIVAGGGAVGEVPYGAHLFESDPAYDVATGAPGAVNATDPPTDVTITIAHYGIIGALGSPPANLFTVFEAASSHCLGTCIHGSLVDVTDEWDDDTTIGAGPGLRNLILKGPPRVGKHYHVQVNGTLKCRDVFGEPESATTKPYTFIFNTN
jgi:hypothetical protein